MDYMMRVMLAAGGGGGGGGGFTNTDTAPPALGGGTGLRLYVAAQHGLYTDAGTTLATAAGQSIYRWKDYSGNNNHLEQPTALLRPTSGSGAQTLYSVSNHSYFTGPSGITSGVTDGEVFGLIKLDAQPQVGTTSGGLWYFGGGNVGVYPYDVDLNIYEGAGTTGRYNFLAPSGLTSWHVYSVKTSGTNWDALKDNTAISGAAQSSNTVAWGTAPQIGASLALSAYLFGQFAAVVFYDGARTAPERASVVAALLAQAPP